MAFSEPVAAVLLHPEIVDVDTCRDETGPLEGYTFVTNPEDTGLARQCEDEESEYDVENLLVFDAFWST